MGTKHSVYIKDDETNNLIERFAEHHGISNSKAARILIHEGIENRDIRYRLGIIDAKVDLIADTLGERDALDETTEKGLKRLEEQTLPRTPGENELIDDPLAEFQPE